MLELEARRTSGTSLARRIVDGERLGVGQGRSKKAAEQEAAKQALAHLESLAS